MAEKLDLFNVLAQFNKHNVEFFESLTDEENKKIHPFVMQRWLSGTTSELQIELINEYSNTTVFDLAHSHRKLAWYVLLATNMQQSQRYKWLKTVPKVKESNKPLSIKVLQETYDYSVKRAEETVSLLSGEAIAELAEMLGWQPSEIQAIMKEHKPSKTK